MKAGAIHVEHAARKFRVYPKESRTLKDLVLSRGRAHDEPARDAIDEDLAARQSPFSMNTAASR